MRATLGAIIVLVVASCGEAPAAAGTSPGVSTEATPSVAATVVPTAMPTSAPLLFAVLEAKGTANAWTYNTVAIAGLDGYARAKATFTPMPVPNLGCMGAILPPSAHVAAGKVFYADARGVIRSLAIDGTVTTAATFPMTSTQQMMSFAVSPDGTKLLGTVYTVPANPAWACDSPASGGTYSFDAYAANFGGTSALVYHQTSTKAENVFELTGWDAVGPFGQYPAIVASQGGGPGSTLGPFVRVDAGTVKPGAQFANPSTCLVWDSVASGAFVCMPDGSMTGGGTPDQRVKQPLSVRRADGTEMWHATVTGQNVTFAPYLSPDGQHVAICCNDLDLTNSHELIVGRDGSQVNLAKGFGTAGWLDATTVAGWVNSNMAYVASSSPGQAVSMGFTGLFVGTVRP